MPNDRREQLIIKTVPADDTVSGVRLVPQILLEAMEALKHGDARVLVALDEMDKTSPPTDWLLKELLESGRLSASGRTIQLTPEERDRLTVLVCMNTDRELEPSVLSLLPKLNFVPLSAELVRSFLETAYPGNHYIQNLVILYQRCLASGMTKPCSLQELEQLLSAITHLRTEERIDPLYNPNHVQVWDTLVRQYITKTDGNLKLLKAVESRIRVDDDRPPLSLSPLAQSMWGEAVVEPVQNSVPVCGLIERSDAAHARLAKMLPGTSVSPCFLGDFVILENKIVLTRPIALSELELLEGLSGLEGEVLVVEPRARLEHVLFLIDRGLRLWRFNRNEVVGFGRGIQLRWMEDAGAHVIVDLSEQGALSDLGIIAVHGKGWVSESIHTDSFFPLLAEPVGERPDQLVEGVTYLLPLAEGVPPAKIWVKRNAQKRAGDSDLLTAAAYVSLPLDPEGNQRLHRELRFEHRLRVFDSSLDEHWGEVKGDQSYMTRQLIVAGDSWSGAVERGFTLAFQDVEALVMMLAKRRLSLRASADIG